MKFKTNLELARFWELTFWDDVQDDEVKLEGPETLAFELLSLSFETSRMASYARDALHYALVAQFRDDSFWEFLLNDTYNLEGLFALDQVDLITVVLLILEHLNHLGFVLPRVCFDVQKGRCCDATMTEATRHFLSSASFETYNFELSPLLVVADAPELPVVAEAQCLEATVPQYP